MEKLAVVILAAGKGTRLKSKTNNKVVIPLAGKPMVTYIVNTLLAMKLKNIFVVVGFAKESVMKALGSTVKYIIQKKRIGTASAIRAAMKQINKYDTVLVVQGDDSALYTPNLINNLLQIHKEKSPVITLLTVKKENPNGLGRIKRKNGKVFAIVEEKNATDKEKNIKEINAACYVFSVQFLKKYLPKVKRNPIKREYYITDLIELAGKDNLPIETFAAPEKVFIGVNTKEELILAQNIMARMNIELTF